MNLINKIANRIEEIIMGKRNIEYSNDNEVILDSVSKIALKSAEESIILLKNDKNVLPLNLNETISVFGRCQFDYFYVGYGSGGDVSAPYYVNVIDGLKNNSVKLNLNLLNKYELWCKKNPANKGIWGLWSMHYPEMKLNDDIVKKAARESQVALVIIGRSAGETRDNKLKKGSYYLTNDEIKELNLVTKYFKKIVVIMNCTNIIDMSWVEKYKDTISSIIYAFPGGMESGNAIANVLIGKTTPSGKLSSTIAKNYKDYPNANNFGKVKTTIYNEDIFVGYRYFETFCKEKVLYPFGYGLSYTKFEIKTLLFNYNNDKFDVSIKVKNIGNKSGKETIQLYYTPPYGKISKPLKNLICFSKTKELEPKESVKIDFCFSLYDIASFDDTGVTGYKNSYVIEHGEYNFYIGNSINKLVNIGKIDLNEAEICKLTEICGVKKSFNRYIVNNINNKIVLGKEKVNKSKLNLKERMLNNLPKEIGYKGNQNINFIDLALDRNKMSKFISQFTNDDLEYFTKGHGMMNSPLGIKGNAGVFGGYNTSLNNKGVPVVVTTDGPTGLRIKYLSSLIPCASALASTWNQSLVKELATLLGAEMLLRESDVILAPALNIQRNVLCGRNFEYFSEDPVLSGKIAASYVQGIQSMGVSACPKHFACNNQEKFRIINNSVLSQRALREIYLKGFEICIKESQPLNIMTSYNKINGVYNYYNYDLATTVLRKEWNYKGNVMTDWWTMKARCPEFKRIKDNAYRIRAQVDVLMPGGSRISKKAFSNSSLLNSLKKKKGITRAEIERSAINVLNMILNLKSINTLKNSYFPVKNLYIINKNIIALKYEHKTNYFHYEFYKEINFNQKDKAELLLNVNNNYKYIKIPLKYLTENEKRTGKISYQRLFEIYKNIK